MALSIIFQEHHLNIYSCDYRPVTLDLSVDDNNKFVIKDTSTTPETVFDHTRSKETIF